MKRYHLEWTPRRDESGPLETPKRIPAADLAQVMIKLGEHQEGKIQNIKIDSAEAEY